MFQNYVVKIFLQKYISATQSLKFVSMNRDNNYIITFKHDFRGDKTPPNTLHNKFFNKYLK